jgi:hypothetical protein
MYDNRTYQDLARRVPSKTLISTRLKYAFNSNIGFDWQAVAHRLSCGWGVDVLQNPCRTKAHNSRVAISENVRYRWYGGVSDVGQCSRNNVEKQY